MLTIKIRRWTHLQKLMKEMAGSISKITVNTIILLQYKKYVYTHFRQYIIFFKNKIELFFSKYATV